MTGFLAFGPCWLCSRGFTFAPDLVPSVPIDPETHLPPDVGHTDPQRAVRKPLCEECVVEVNEVRVRNGQAEVEVLPGAYAVQETW